MDRLDAALIDIPGVAVCVVERCGSTNAVLLGEALRVEAALLAAEEQTAGRGRRGRRWHSSPGADVTFSLARRVRRPTRELAALSLVAGVAAASASRSLGAGAAALKWPNDLVVGSAKLGGILVETRPEGAETRAVFGIGINCRRAGGLEQRLRRAVASLDQFIAPGRNAVIEAIARALMAAVDRFEALGFEAVRPEWEALHAHAGQRLRVRLADGSSISGIARGLAADGALRLATRRGERAVRSGRVISARVA
jgi:BirA family transcriptional regulator, biotin operon repressor / biotin---[acetyl-CoA-carboxylase] ligase